MLQVFLRILTNHRYDISQDFQSSKILLFRVKKLGLQILATVEAAYQHMNPEELFEGPGKAPSLSENHRMSEMISLAYLRKSLEKTRDS